VKVNDAIILREFSFVPVIFVVINMLDVAEGENQNLTGIQWSHATNSQHELDEVLKSIIISSFSWRTLQQIYQFTGKTISMIEADIIYGHLRSHQSGEELLPVMGHPPLTDSDISLQDFMLRILEFNKNSSKDEQKGVKLDFKSTDVYVKSLPLLKTLWSRMDFPVWINADILSGPVNNILTKPVDADVFFQGSKDFTNVVLSPGWTTKWSEKAATDDDDDGHYTIDQVNEMIDAIKRNEIRNGLTFPIRAGIAGGSLTQLSHLFDSLKDSNHVTFTIWSSADDYVDVEKLRELIFHFGVDRVYIDVPKKLYEQLRLDLQVNHSPA